ncbi:MAG TPA: thiamine pyrophosphate-dependent enzyme [Chloroflexota bacterium]|nr:thiamine pyrophosphate-dependent enzyme [Chloroflexota bacterium]
MNRLEVLEALAALRRGVPLVIGPGLANYPIAALADDPLTIYNMDMPYVTPTALGIALGWPARRVVAVEGDGSLLAGPGVLATIARYQVRNLIVLVFDNGAYLTTGSGRATTATSHGTDVEGLGRAAGLVQACTVADLPAARAALQRAFAEPGPWLIVAKVDTSDRDRAPRDAPLPVAVYEAGLRFRRAALAQPALFPAAPAAP